MRVCVCVWVIVCLCMSVCVCASSLHRGHANLLCIVPMLTDDPRRESSACRRPSGRCSKVHGSHALPDPGALNSCVHTFVENNAGGTLVQHMILCIWIWDLRPSMWNCAKLTLRELTVGWLSLPLRSSSVLRFAASTLYRFGATLVLSRFPLPLRRFAVSANAALRKPRSPFRGPRYGRLSKVQSGNMGPAPGRLWLSQGHVGVNASGGSGIWHPQLKTSQIQPTSSDRTIGPVEIWPRVYTYRWKRSTVDFSRGEECFHEGMLEWTWAVVPFRGTV